MTAIREANAAIVPIARPVHEQRVECIDGKRADGLQDVGDCWCPWTRIAVVVDHVGEQATDARTVLVLHEHVAVIGIAAHGCKDHRNRFGAKIPARCNACRIVVNPADGHVAVEFNLSRDRVFKSQSVSPDPCLNNAFRLKITRERQRLVLPDVLYIEALPGEVTDDDEDHREGPSQSALLQGQHGSRSITNTLLQHHLSRVSKFSGAHVSLAAAGSSSEKRAYLGRS